MCKETRCPRVTFSYTLLFNSIFNKQKVVYMVIFLAECYNFALESFHIDTTGRSQESYVSLYII